MKLTANSLFIIFAILMLGLAALFPLSIVAAQVLVPRSLPTSNPQATLEAIVQQTVVALTQTAPTQTPLPPTATAIPATNTPAPTATFVPTSTPVSYCDWVAFIKDVTIPDGATLQPGETFVKTWRLKNRGTCTWTPDYMLVFVNGAQMSSATATRLPGYVAPGQTVDVSVAFTAPTTPGHYTSYWMLRNSAGVLFGAGDNANKAFYADIKVARESLPHGTVKGTIYYPSEFNPPMTLYFQKVGTNELIQFSIPENRNEFSLLLPNGTYYAYAWAPGYNLEGAYVKTDGTLRQFTVTGGATTYSIDITDWTVEHHLPGS